MYKGTIRSGLAALVCVSLSACQTGGTMLDANPNPAAQEKIDSLAWVKTADPEADARAAIAQGQRTLLRMAGRSASLPGLSAEEAALCSKKCSVEILPGTGDAVYGEEHLARLKQARAYAEAYNRVMAEVCR